MLKNHKKQVRILVLFLLTLTPLSLRTNPFVGIMRLIFTDNIAVIQKDQAYRSGMLRPDKLEKVVREKNIKSVINLRGEPKDKKWWQDQKALLDNLGVDFYSLSFSAQQLPKRREVERLLDIFQHAKRPILIHCLAGVDRTGEAAALWQLTQQHYSKYEALKQLSSSFGHFKSLYPAKSLFIKLWQNKNWLLNNYYPEDYPKLKDKTIRSRSDDNFHTVSEGKLYRSAHLSPSELTTRMHDHKIKTVINLIGRRETSEWWQKERLITERNGGTHLDIQLSTDYLPSKQSLQKLLFSYEHAERPILIHCREGADRTGEAAALWRLHIEKKTIEEALKELSRTYHHYAIFHPGKRYFIRQWQGSEWGLSTYDPKDFRRYVKN